MNDPTCDPTFDPSFYRSDFFSNPELDEPLTNLLPFESTEFSGWSATLHDASPAVAPIIRDLPLNNWAAASDYPIVTPPQFVSHPNLFIPTNVPVCEAADSSTPKHAQPKKRKQTKPKSAASEDLVTVSSNEMNELLDDHRNVELRKKQKRDYARKKRAFERTLREKFPVMEAELAALQKQNEQLKAQLSQNANHAPATDAHVKLDLAVKQLASMGFNLNATFSHGVATTKKAKKPKRKNVKMETGSSSPSSSSSDDESPVDSRSVTSQELVHAISGVSHLLQETHVSTETQLGGLQQVMDSSAVRALNLLSSQLAIATKEPGNINALNSHAADQAVLAMRAAHAQLTAALREYNSIAQRSFSHLSASLAPEQLARCLQGLPLQ